MIDINRLGAGQFEQFLFSRVLQLKLEVLALLERFPELLPAVLALVLVSICLFVVRYVLRLRKSLSMLSVFLELTPPAKTEQEAYTTEQLFSLIHGIGSMRTWYERLIGFKPIYALEIISSRDEGIRYLIRVPLKDVNTFQRSLLSYLPNMSVKKVDKEVPKQSKNTKIIEFKLAHHFAYPLKKQESLEKHDPIAYVTGMMTKLQPDEVISLQILLSPAQSREARTLSRLIRSNGDVMGFINNKQPGVSSSIVSFIYLLFSIPFWLVSDIISNGTTPFPKQYQPMQANQNKTAYEQELLASIHTKIDKPLFETTIRVYLSVSGKKNVSERISGVFSSFSTFSNPHQSLIYVRLFKFPVFKKYLYFAYTHRLFSFASRSLFSASEISDIYHFPYTKMTKTEDIVKIYSKQLPAPLALKKADQFDISFAKNTYGGTETIIGLTEEERRRHMYILGATGTGKSTLLLSMIQQDMKNGKGLCVIDPHGDLIEKILPCIPDERKNDVIYFNPDDIGYPIGVNLLELSEDLSEEDQLREKEFVTESIISLFHKIYSDKYSGPRMEYILRNTIHTSFTIPNPTLFTIYKLLINTPYRKSVVSRLEDENLKDFWKYEFSKAGDYQKVKMISPITNKIGRFLFSPMAKRILEKEKSTINFDNILDTGKILLCNLSKGRLGEDTSNVFGGLIMTKIQLAALKRARTSAEDRRDFYLYVDEFQNFATPSFAQILSEARKYRLSAILAHQTTSQLEDVSLVNITLANTGTIICFRTANPEDERLILPQFTPYIQQGEIANLPSFHFYMKINAINPEEPFSGETIPVNVRADKKRVNEIIQQSRNVYAEPYFHKEPSKTSVNLNPHKSASIVSISTLSLP